MTRNARRALIAFAVIVLLAVLIGTLVLAKTLLTDDTAQEVRLPLFAILGVIALLCALALIAVVFASLDLTDKSQALALPEGSVRAVIALSLIVLFAIVSVSLYSSLADGPVRLLEGLTGAKRTELVNDARMRLLTVDSVGRVDSTKTPPTTTYSYNVNYWSSPSQASQDFAKQLLVMIGTLVTSIASFYFGAKAAAGSTPTESAPPALQSGVPPSVVRDVKSDVTLKGTDLLTVKSATLTRGTESVDLADVTSSATEVKGNVTIPSTAQAGAWDVVVTDTRGRVARLGGAINVT